MGLSHSLSRPVSSIPKTHRASTLKAIANKTREHTERIEFLKAEGQRMRQLFHDMPEEADSRLAWLNRQLNNL